MRSRSLPGAIVFLAFLAGGLLVGCGEDRLPPIQELGTAPEHLSDVDISSAIDGALVVDERVSAEDLNVSSVDGVVTLSGTVPNLLAEERALEIARSTKGVVSVIDRITVEPAERSDSEIELDVLGALTLDPATESYEVDVEVDDGVVTLTGNVQSWAEKWLAADVASTVTGIRGVENEIDVDYAEERADHEIETDIEGRLESDVWVDDGLISVDVDHGQVMLTGVVGSASEKWRAERDALVAGVSSVENDLEIKWWARNEMRRAERFADMTDEEIRAAVDDALLFDPRVLSLAVQVSVENGVATLGGTVASLKAKRAAVEDAENTLGVWRVVDNLEVRPADEIADAELEEMVSDALQRDIYVDRDQIEVEVRGGIAYLDGSVDSQFEKSRAESVVGTVPFVVEVMNNIYVDAEWPLKSDEEIREDIEHEFYWNPWLMGSNIDVSVENGVATLTGTVDSWFETSIARQEALKAGAREVRSELDVLYGSPPYIP